MSVGGRSVFRFTPARPAAFAVGGLVLVALQCANDAVAQSEEGQLPVDAPRFETLDVDGDGHLSLEEFVGKRRFPRILSRDFRLFDADSNGLLTEDEFRSIPFGADGVPRGAIADPYAGVLERAVSALDESYDAWNHRADESVDSTNFTINYIASISMDGRRRLDRVMILHADANRDRRVSRDEAIRFLTTQLGLRWVTNDPLRFSDGRVVDFTEFLRADTDQDNVVDKSEFIDSWWNSIAAEEDFEKIDANDDGKVTLAEFADPSGPNVRDPIQMFRKADSDLDGRLDARELMEATPRSRMYLVEPNRKAFDRDRDGKLSLTEYRLSMLGTYNYPWENIPKDEDRDNRLSLEEFKFSQRSLFQLQRRFFFHRLDRDSDGKLSSDEFEFRKYKLYSLHRVSVDGEDSREIYKDEDYPVCGSPAVSADGRWILFDATPPEGTNKSQILLMTADGEDARELCDGLMPSWSADGQQFACSRYEGGSSVWIMNLDGTAGRRIDDGWAAQWSPDGKSIVYTNDNSIRVLDVNSGKTRVVLAKGSHPYLYVYWNMAWSPDSRQLVFKGKLRDKQEIAIINMTGNANLKRQFSTKEEMGDDFAWSPDGRRIVFNMQSRKHQRSLMYQLDLESGGPPKLVPEANVANAWTSVCFSPDGQWMVLATPN